MPHDVFVSYSSIDKAAADAACATFEASGIRCWIAPRDVPAGSEWAEGIIDAIESAKVMVLIFSSNANESRQVKREIELAVSRGLTIMPIRLEQIEPTRSMAYYMAGVHWLDALTPPLETHLKKLVEWIKPHLTEGRTQEPPAARPAQPKTTEAPQSKPGIRFPWSNRAEEPKPAAKPKKKEAFDPFEGLYDTIFGENTKGSVNDLADLSSMFQAGLKAEAAGKRQEAVDAYRKLISRFDGDTRPLYREQVIRSFYNAANNLQALGRHADAIASYDSALKRAEGREAEGTRQIAARALHNRALSHEKQGLIEDAIAGYEEVVRRFGGDTDGGARQQAGMSLVNKGILLGASRREDEAIRVYDDFLKRFGSDQQQEANAAEAMFNIGAAHGVKGRNAEAVAAYERLVDRFRGVKDPTVSEFIAKALYNSGNRLSDLKKPAEAIRAYEEVINIFGDDRRMPERVAKAMINRANQLGIMGKRKEANSGYQAVIDKFLHSPNAEVQAQVTNARKWKS